MSKKDLTRNQHIVFDALLSASSPLTAYKILDLPAVQHEGLKAPLTIYRALEGLLEKGLAHRIESLNAFVACSSAPHEDSAGFMICEKCGTTIELPINACETPLRKQASKNGFHLHKISIEMLGVCRDCRENV
jgi:Fur family transcriptional regulator, zinc uptake regulator